MSELQIGLLAIGLMVVIGVYGYGYWQQRAYRRKFGAVFEQHEPDVLTEAAHTPVWQTEREPLLDLAALVKETDTPLPAADAVCDLIEGKTDYLAHFRLATARQCDYLAALWDKRFVYGRSLNVCGRSAADARWERVVPECVAGYVEFRIGLQFADRSGPASLTRLSGFHDLMQQIAQQGGELEILPVEEAVQRARQLDEFCAKVDRTIGLNIAIRPSRTLFASEVADIVQLLGFSLQADGSFQLLDAHGQTVFSLADCVGNRFQHHTLTQTRVSCLTLLLEVPRVAQPVARFEEMGALALKLAEELKGVLMDDYRRELNAAALPHITAEVRKIEAEMLAGGISPGSAQALRLFA